MSDAMRALANKLSIWKILQSHRGKENAISQNDLAAQAGVQPRCAREIVKSLIEDDHNKICSAYTCGGGYYIPKTQAEVADTRKVLRSHALSILRRYKAMDGDINALQMELFGGLNGGN